MSFLLQEEHITQIRIKTFHQQIQLNRPETMIEVCRGTDTLGLLLFQVLGKLDNRHFATDSRHMQILVKRLRGTETARIRQTKINVLGRIETDIRTRTEDQMIDQIMFVETAADQKAPFLILPLVLQKQATDMNRLVHDTIIPQHLILQLVEVIFQATGKFRRHKQAFISRIGILRTGDNRHVRRMPVCIRITISPVITLPVRMLRRSIDV